MFSMHATYFEWAITVQNIKNIYLKKLEMEELKHSSEFFLRKFWQLYWTFSVVFFGVPSNKNDYIFIKLSWIWWTVCSFALKLTSVIFLWANQNRDLFGATENRENHIPYSHFCEYARDSYFRAEIGHTVQNLTFCFRRFLQVQKLSQKTLKRANLAIFGLRREYMFSRIFRNSIFVLELVAKLSINGVFL